jgi:hypothetical protein
MGFELTTLVLIGTDCIGSWIYVHDHDRPLFSYCSNGASKILQDIAESGVKHQKSINHMKFSVTGQEKGDLLIQVTAQ